MQHKEASINYNNFTLTIIPTIFSLWRIAAVRWQFKDYAPIQKAQPLYFHQFDVESILMLMILFSDAESHILFFDIEGLIFELHSEEYAAMSPTTLEVSNLKSEKKEKFKTKYHLLKIVYSNNRHKD